MMDEQDKTEHDRRRKARNLVLGLTLAFFAVLFYAITIARM